MCKVTLKHNPVKKLAPLTTRSGSLRFASATEQSTTLLNSTPKRTGQNPEIISQETIYHGILARTSSRYQASVKMLWKPSEDDLAPWTACRQNDLRADQPYQPTRTPVHHLHQQAVAMTNLSRTQQT